MNLKYNWTTYLSLRDWVLSKHIIKMMISTWSFSQIYFSISLGALDTWIYLRLVLFFLFLDRGDIHIVDWTMVTIEGYVSLNNHLWRSILFKKKSWMTSYVVNCCQLINPLTARIFTVFGHNLLEGRVLHKEVWVAKLLGTHFSVQV